MPKECVDYSNTIIYKIFCKTQSITDVYVGHTTNFIQRKYNHKTCSNNVTNRLKIYEIIRKNGGWDNWDMIEIAKYNCKDHTEARIKEQEHYDKLNCSLNSIPPFLKKIDTIYCETKNTCNHNMSSNLGNCYVDKPELNDDIIVQKSSDNFICGLCDYKSIRFSQYTRHLNTSKHKFIQNVANTRLKSSEPINYSKYNCICGKTFSHRQSLFVHKKNCKPNITNDNNITFEEPITKELVMQLLKQNQNLQEMLHNQHNKMYDIAKEGKNVTNNTTNNFNLNVFLNEKCKDAVNLMDFVDSLKVKLKDLEYTARLGYAEGISQIFINELFEMDVHIRPIHCSDSKRDVLYIKDHDLWEKDDEEKTKLTKAIKIIGNKNIQQIGEWQKANPGYNDPSSKQNDRYMKMICNAMSGSTKEESEKNYEKIIKNITKEVIIDKTLESI